MVVPQEGWPARATRGRWEGRQARATRGRQPGYCYPTGGKLESVPLPGITSVLALLRLSLLFIYVV